jgi:hypothetical protein
LITFEKDGHFAQTGYAFAWRHFLATFETSEAILGLGQKRDPYAVFDDFHKWWASRRDEVSMFIET